MSDGPLGVDALDHRSAAEEAGAGKVQGVCLSVLDCAICEFTFGVAQGWLSPWRLCA